jgi:ubiquinone/menaquinone biosynthesis C-methylase UbiE
MPEHEDVYRNEAERYHALVSFEDHNNNLSTAISQIIPSSQSILETGAGTGRVTKIITPLAHDLVSFDLSVPMVSMANTVSHPSSLALHGYAAADHRFLPVGDNKYDWVVSGWSVCYLVSWQQENWKNEVCRALTEFCRVLKPEGYVLIIETEGTGKTSPKPPSHLVEYLDFLEEIGFQRKWIRTDYLFPDAAIARELTEFFFGAEMLTSIEFQAQPILPECTGLWVCQLSDLTKNLPE